MHTTWSQFAALLDHTIQAKRRLALLRTSLPEAAQGADRRTADGVIFALELAATSVQKAIDAIAEATPRDGQAPTGRPGPSPEACSRIHAHLVAAKACLPGHVQGFVWPS